MYKHLDCIGSHLLKVFIHGWIIFGFLFDHWNQFVDHPLIFASTFPWIVSNVNLFNFIPMLKQMLANRRQVITIQNDLLAEPTKKNQFEIQKFAED